jgi:hypothetical protein
MLCDIRRKVLPDNKAVIGYAGCCVSALQFVSSFHREASDMLGTRRHTLHFTGLRNTDVHMVSEQRDHMFELEFEATQSPELAQKYEVPRNPYH